jgi:hypothetical protein
MAECEFVVGYPIIEEHKPISGTTIAIVCVALFFLISWIAR